MFMLFEKLLSLLINNVKVERIQPGAYRIFPVF